MMKRLTILMLLLGSTNVLAEWTWVGGTEYGDYGFEVYVDLETIHKKGNKAKMWRMYSYNTQQTMEDKNNKYWSSRGINEFDCIEETSKTLAFSYLSEKMGSGQEIYYANITTDKAEEVHIAPGTIVKTLFNIACGKRK
jgi:hypothetical protein